MRQMPACEMVLYCDSPCCSYSPAAPPRQIKKSSTLPLLPSGIRRHSPSTSAPSINFTSLNQDVSSSRRRIPLSARGWLRLRVRPHCCHDLLLPHDAFTYQKTDGFGLSVIPTKEFWCYQRRTFHTIEGAIEGKPKQSGVLLSIICCTNSVIFRLAFQHSATR